VQRAIRRAKEGDEEALRFLYVRHADNVYGYVTSIVRDEHEAEDITQQVFTKLITHLPRQQRDVPFSAWILRVARNVAVDHLRELPDDQRTVVVMRHVVGLSPTEIATQMGKTESSVHGLHHRARGTLRRALIELECAPATVDRRARRRRAAQKDEEVADVLCA
jgi:RNA polymerase sigma-70 factor, ECF subfamily